MTNINKFLFFGVLYLTTTVSAEIRETNFMQNAFANASSGDIIVLDIDNTISEPMQTLGSDQWYAYQVDRYKQAGLDESHAINAAIEDETQIVFSTEVQPVEMETPNLIKNAQQNGIMVIALTARPVEWAKPTVKQLESIGVQFKNYGFQYTDNKTIDFNNGILFVGPKNNKGTVLAQFFETLNIQTKKLIFIDDKEKHVKNMEEVFSKTTLKNINFRYGATDEKVKSFSPKIAEIEWNYFKQYHFLLTDEQAMNQFTYSFAPMMHMLNLPYSTKILLLRSHPFFMKVRDLETTDICIEMIEWRESLFSKSDQFLDDSLTFQLITR